MKSQPMRSLLVLSLLLLTAAANGQEGKHLFILSGQSNMQGHRPDEAFTPAVQEALGTEQVIVIQDALGGQPIQRWYKAWKDP
ncbi:MAG: acetyl xylan esterase, partial [Planctomycetota bacterium]|nr:acetyl xylan esterase [Planctomycetota bacterium]